MKKLLLTIPTLLGTEQIVANEVRRLGYETTQVKDGSVTFEGDAEAICLANINLRSAERIMIKVAEFKATTFDELFEKIKRINWESIIEADAAFPVKGQSLKSDLHSVPDFQKIIKKAIVDRLSAHYGITHFEETGPLYPIQFSLIKDVATIYIDTSGENLYKRGYREKSVLAPMRETLAYSMIDLSFWRGDRIFLDPFCGSGTLPIEAALYACNIAPGINRKFVAESWRNHIPREMWKDARDEAKDNARLDT
ncbi:MAG: class I SAM-dependent RNA methyltransferase, partial [Clostridia bacterium]|nr:class I SAM-dependent RNA methyltransferase [Clostridia bacterium]